MSESGAGSSNGLSCSSVLPVQISIPRTEERSSMGGLKAYTAYCIQVNDFGRTYTVERRFDDFQKLHDDIKLIDAGVPPLPEKKMWASTDASVVAERRPAFENILNYMLRSEVIAFESSQHLWKFIDMPLPGMVSARYLYNGKQIRYLSQCAKLLEAKYEKEHAYRLCNDVMIATNLRLLAADGALAKTPASASTDTVAPPAADKPAGVDEDGFPSLDATPAAGASQSGGKFNDPEYEAHVFEMLRYAVAQGGTDSRKRFLESHGLRTMLEQLQRMARRDGAGPTPDQRVRNVLNALIHAEGERYPAIFADFLRRGGVAVLSGFRELCGEHAPFAEFIGKLLWLAWDADTQAAFLQADTGGEQALALLSALFISGTKSGQIMAGLLLSSLIANESFTDRDREAKAAAGISRLVEDLVVSLPSAGALKAAQGGGNASKTSNTDDAQAAEAFITSVGRNERSFTRLLGCLATPFDQERGCVMAAEDNAVWSACAFALWCLVKIQPKPSRLAAVRALLPGLAQSGPSRVRWLVGELLLHLHVAADSGGSAGVTSELSADAMAQEQHIVEATMAEQINHSLGQLRYDLQQNRGVMSQQEQLVREREQEFTPLCECSWNGELDAALQKLASVRKKLAEAAASMQSKESANSQKLDGLESVVQKDSAAGDGDMSRALQGVHEIEGLYTQKKAEHDQFCGHYAQQNNAVEEANKEVEECERKVGAMRKLITDMEQELSNKQREAQNLRILASSDTSALQGQIEQMDNKLAELREKAGKLQGNGDGQPVDQAKKEEIMANLKQEAAKCKQRKAELQADLQKASQDPAALEESTLRAERATVELQEQLMTLRSSELVDLERAHYASREQWQLETTRLQDIRWRRDSSERECNDLKRQLEDRWRLWQPLWSSRLKDWHEKAIALGEAQFSGGQFESVVSANWELLHEEQAARQELLRAIANAQQSLAELANQMMNISELGI